MDSRTLNHSEKSDKSSTLPAAHPALSTLAGFRRFAESTQTLEKTDNHPLTENTTPSSLENVPGSNTGHNFKQTYGGKVKNTQPPALCGFFMPATTGDCNQLPGVARDKIPTQCGKTCSVSVRTLEGSRQLYTCPNFKQTYETNAMNNANSHAIGAPAPMGKGLTLPTGEYCLIPSSVLLDTLKQAKHDQATHGRGNAYGQLLEHFHRAILPAFFVETRGNLSEVSRLLGIHRTTAKEYAILAGVDMSGASTVGGDV